MQYLKSLLAASDQPDSLGASLRSKRFHIFENLLDAHFPKGYTVQILDVGGTAYFWEHKKLLRSGRVEVTLLNLQEEHNLPTGIKSRQGDATNMADIKENQFDVVFSNSVIEHLYTWTNQLKMAKEVMRVGKKFFVQTPNKHFFVEAHYAIPFIQYFPKNVSYQILTKTKLSRWRKWQQGDAKQYLDEIRLINKREMRKLFPGSKIYCEKFLGMTKSFTAHNM